MAANTYDVGILGGGAAGLTVAAGAARFGARVLLVEKSGRLGGDCLYRGCVPSKSLLYAAGVWAEARRSASLGLPPLELPPVDLGAVMDRVSAVIGAVGVRDAPERFRSLGVEVRFGAARFVDPRTVVLDEEKLSARRWVVATGSRPAIPPVDGLPDVPYWTNETVFTQRVLPARLLVLGGGPVGLELGQAFARLGSRVTVVEFLERILAAEDPDVSELLAGRLAADGMEIRTATRAVRAEKEGTKMRLFVSPASGGGELPLEADALLVATGRRPNTEGLDLEKAGVAVTPKGIPVDRRMRTDVAHIYACGDVTGKLPFTHTAGEGGAVALSNLLLRLPRSIDYDLIPRCTYTDPEVASVGLDETRAGERGASTRVFTFPFGEVDRAEAEGRTAGRIKILVGKWGKILGCSIVGPGAGELIHEWAVALKGGLRLSAVASAVHAYPTLSEISKKGAGLYYAEKLFTPRVRCLLRLLFGVGKDRPG